MDMYWSPDLFAIYCFIEPGQNEKILKVLQYGPVQNYAFGGKVNALIFCISQR